MRSEVAIYSKLHRTAEPSAVVLEFTNIYRVQCGELIGKDIFPTVLKGI